MYSNQPIPQKLFIQIKGVIDTVKSNWNYGWSVMYKKNGVKNIKEINVLFLFNLIDSSLFDEHNFYIWKTTKIPQGDDLRFMKDGKEVKLSPLKRVVCRRLSEYDLWALLWQSIHIKDMPSMKIVKQGESIITDVKYRVKHHGQKRKVVHPMKKKDKGSIRIIYTPIGGQPHK